MSWAAKCSGCQVEVDLSDESSYLYATTYHPRDGQAKCKTCGSVPNWVVATLFCQRCAWALTEFRSKLNAQLA